MNLLLRLARAVLDNVLSQLTQQKNIVAELALKPMNMMIQQVGGGIWIGKGADAFVQEVQSLCIPQTRAIETTIGTLGVNLTQARERIERADQDVNRLIQGRLLDAFRFF
jgi:uncharacterized protein YukE